MLHEMQEREKNLQRLSKGCSKLTVDVDCRGCENKQECFQLCGVETPTKELIRVQDTIKNMKQIKGIK